MLYVLAPVLVRVLLDGSGHDSAEIDGTVERHATSSPTKQPVPAPRYSAQSKANLELDIKDTASPQPRKTAKSKIPELLKSPPKSDKDRTLQTEEAIKSPKSPSAKSKIPIKLKTHEQEIIEIKTAVTKPSEPNFQSQQEVETRTSTTTTYSNQYVPSEDFEQLQKIRSFEIPEISELRRQVSQEDSLDPDLEELKDGEVSCKTVRKSTIMKSGSSEPEVWTETVTTKTLPDGRQDTWKSVTSGSLQSEIWDTQCSLDTSPGSGNGDLYTKNEAYRHELNSDTDSEGSPQPRRRSPSKRRTLGSSSGSDVALHEGAELSPLEDDQGTSLTANLLSKPCTYPANLLPIFIRQNSIPCLIICHTLVNEYITSAIGVLRVLQSFVKRDL